MNGPEIFDTLQAISPKNKIVRSFEQHHDIQDIEDQDDFFHQKMTPFSEKQSSSETKN